MANSHEGFYKVIISAKPLEMSQAGKVNSIFSRCKYYKLASSRREKQAWFPTKSTCAGTQNRGGLPMAEQGEQPGVPPG